MRSVGLSDLDMATRAIAASQERAFDAATALIEAAHVADKVRKRTGKAHPNGGTGSLFAQAALEPVALCDAGHADYLEALAGLLQALQAWRGRLDHRS